MNSHSSRTAFTLALALACALSLTANATAPRTIGYQGRLTDGGGSPLTGVYSITFAIYDLPVGGSMLWSETQPAVSVTDGLFSVEMGTVNQILNSVFSTSTRYLGVTVGADPEITPRTKFASVAYAQRISTIDGSSGGDVTGDVVVFDGPDTVVFVDASQAMIKTYGSDGLEQARIWGNSWGELYLYDGVNNDRTVTISGTLNSGGNIGLTDELGVQWIELDGGASGDDAVIFPDDAVNTHEILDEVGVTNRIQPVGAMQLTSADSTIALRTINAPEDGYVLAIGSVTVNTVHVMGNQEVVEVTIRPTAGGSGISVTNRVGTGSNTANWESPVTIHGMFSVSAGANQFVFEAREVMGNAQSVEDGQLTLIYIPTLYGPLASNDQPTPPTSYQDPKDELLASQEFNLRRIESEMAALRAKLDALSAKVESQENK
ncbi:MAG TPA: hypothetical protein VLB27_04450 [candidate division Zixibacteria bacterium]|nr:hypothetical protein [candidate division Zixibacteria bacterium]